MSCVTACMHSYSVIKAFPVIMKILPFETVYAVGQVFAKQNETEALTNTIVSKA